MPGAQRLKAAAGMESIGDRHFSAAPQAGIFASHDRASGPDLEKETLP
jgi:hypothetical protein